MAGNQPFPEMESGIPEISVVFRIFNLIISFVCGGEDDVINPLLHSIITVFQNLLITVDLIHGIRQPYHDIAPSRHTALVESG